MPVRWRAAATSWRPSSTGSPRRWRDLTRMFPRASAHRGQGACARIGTSAIRARETCCSTCRRCARIWRGARSSHAEGRPPDLTAPSPPSSRRLSGCGPTANACWTTCASSAIASTSGSCGCGCCSTRAVTRTRAAGPMQASRRATCRICWPWRAPGAGERGGGVGGAGRRQEYVAAPSADRDRAGVSGRSLGAHPILRRAECVHGRRSRPADVVARALGRGRARAGDVRHGAAGGSAAADGRCAERGGPPRGPRRPSRPVARHAARLRQGREPGGVHLPDTGHRRRSEQPGGAGAAGRGAAAFR